MLVCMHIGTGIQRGLGLDYAKASKVIAGSSAVEFPRGHPDHERAVVAFRTLRGGFGGFGDVAVRTIPALIGGGVPERFPNVHFVFVETGARWLLNLMDTMDDAWYRGPGVREVNRVFFGADGRRYDQFLPEELDLAWPFEHRPSDYVRRQFHVTFQDDWVALRNRPLTGTDCLLWGNDYPHPEGCWPESRVAVPEQIRRSGVDSSEATDIFGGTLRRLLRLPA